MTKPELQARYFELYDEKPKSTLSKPELEKLISDAENRISAGAEDAGELGNQAGTESDGEVDHVNINKTLSEELEKDGVARSLMLKEEIVRKSNELLLQAEIKAALKVKDGKRHLVYKDGKEVWWTPAVIEVMYKSFGERISFPENTQYIFKNPKKCVDCG